MRSLRIIAGTALLALAAAGCGGGSTDNPLDSGASSSGGGETVTVGSAAFPESVLLAEIYAGALEAADVKVERKLSIGEREVYYKLLEKGDINVLPEYNGALLAYLDPEAALPATTEETNAAITAKLPGSLKILTSAAAEDNDSLTVTADTATKNNLKTIADLAPVAKDFTVGGPAPFEKRYKDKLNEAYGLTFKEWKPDRSGGGNIPTWLKNGDVQVGNVFTTTPAIVLDKLVVLEDPKGVFGRQNVTPLVSADGVPAAGQQALDAVSAKLTTQGLLDMMNKVATDKTDPAVVAKEWLTANL
ncbi:osmoprotectant transport system substrate-binding protein [Actinocorallia herbida]|uniref:Osmoprotectant transport system substrate-binding protein n=1 Tax=Actinocorallia herbida TaxID=58109 RepID=A0A3N1CPM7_9ACTN|nr:ABC transporter substrate-binding protein [Actinocorallia herbida]ROO83252.1 osmoprotectant transport system substrate-binding protein [Actinocorallia herbida]